VGDHKQVTFGDNAKGKLVGLGKVDIKDLYFSNVLHIDSLTVKLLSIAQLCNLGLTCTFSDVDVFVSIKEDKSLIIRGFRPRNIYLVIFFL
jgi:hypothetical protein